MLQRGSYGPQGLQGLEQELSIAWDTIEEWKAYDDRCRAEDAKANANKEAQIQELLKALQGRDTRIRNQDEDILAKTRQITRLTLDNRNLTKLKGQQETMKHLKAEVNLRAENQQQKDRITNLQGRLYNVEGSARQACTSLRGEIQQHKNWISNLQGQLNTATQSANQDRSKLREEIQQQMDKISGLQGELDLANESAEQARERQKALSDQHQEAVSALDELKEELAKCKKKLKRSRAAMAEAEEELEKVKDMDRKGCSLARDVRYWDKNRRAESYSQAGKYEQDAVRAAKEFDCGCSTCEKRG